MASRGELAWTVVSEPSWPVFIACSMSSASAPRHLADDDAVGPHAQRVAHEVTDRDLALALDVRRARLEAEHVALMESQLGGVLDGDDPLVVWDRARQRVEQCRLPGARSAGDEHVELREDAALQEVDAFAEIVPMLIMSSSVSRFRENFRIVSSGPESESGAMIAFTRDPSGSRASTIGDDSSMRRPTCATIRLMMRRRWLSSVKRTVVS